VGANPIDTDLRSFFEARSLIGRYRYRLEQPHERTLSVQFRFCRLPAALLDQRAELLVASPQFFLGFADGAANRRY